MVLSTSTFLTSQSHYYDRGVGTGVVRFDEYLVYVRDVHYILRPVRFVLENVVLVPSEDLLAFSDVRLNVETDLLYVDEVQVRGRYFYSELRMPFSIPSYQGSLLLTAF